VDGGWWSVVTPRCDEREGGAAGSASMVATPARRAPGANPQPEPVPREESCCFELCFPAPTPLYIFLFMLIARCSYIIALTEVGRMVGVPCSFYYLLFSMFLYIIFI